MTEALEPLLVKHQRAKNILDVGDTKYRELVRQGEIEVVGERAMSRAVFASLKRYVVRLQAKAAGKAA